MLVHSESTHSLPVSVSLAEFDRRLQDGVVEVTYDVWRRSVAARKHYCPISRIFDPCSLYFAMASRVDSPDATEWAGCHTCYLSHKAAGHFGTSSSTGERFRKRLLLTASLVVSPRIALADCTAQRWDAAYECDQRAPQKRHQQRSSAVICGPKHPP